MLEYNRFKKLFLDNIYSLNKISDETIQEDYYIYSDGIKQSKDLALELLNGTGYNISDDEINNILNDNSRDYYKVMEDSLLDYLEDNYGNETIMGSGMCLKSNLIGRACQTTLNGEEMFGVVREFDNDSTKFLLIDFGGSENIKINIKKLRIVGQKD